MHLGCARQLPFLTDSRAPCSPFCVVQVAALQAQLDSGAAEAAALQQELRDSRARVAELEATIAKAGLR